MVSLLGLKVGRVNNTESLRRLEGILRSPSENGFIVVSYRLVSQEYTVFLRGNKSEFTETQVIDLVGNLVPAHEHWWSL